jgi:hypothetical protein
MSIKITKTITKVETQGITCVTCDNCKKELDAVSIYEEQKITEYKRVEDKSTSLDGIDLKFCAGYGTTYDMTTFNITLCTNCLADMIRQFGGIARQ